MVGEMPKRQTATFLIRRFEEAGIRPDTRKGQNFLVDLNLLELLVDAAQLTHQDVALEIGTGLGSLTALLAARAGAVVTVEVDEHLRQLAAEQLAEFTNITMLGRDALRNKNNLHPEVLAAVDRHLREASGRQLKLVANLPYKIATPVISNLLSTTVTPVSMTVTIQKELADRITARPATKAYGALSIWIQSQCEAEILRVMPPAVFWPRPKVHSAIVQIVPVQAKRQRIPDLLFFQQFVRSLFLHRRKYLRSALLSASKPHLGKPDVDQLLAEHQLGPDARAEQLSIEQMLQLSESVRRVVQAANAEDS
jgi:16S rRNA (adenine1518-N6/adenine1519-N6)-dimethyltransferase